MAIPKREKKLPTQSHHRGCNICQHDVTLFSPDDLPSLWINSDHVVAHPNAPVGGGGVGNFHASVPLGRRGNTSVTVPHPASPVGRNYLLKTEEQNGLVMATENPPPKAPPATEPIQKTIKKKLGKYTEIDVVIEITPDSLNDASVTESSANTSIVVGDVAPEFNTTCDVDDQGKVSKINGKVEYKGTLTVQIRYRSGIDPAARVAYGRGTTEADIAAGNVSIGFHEWCHQQDLWTWLTTREFPEFKGKVGMTEEEFTKAQDDLDAAWQQYFDDSHEFTYGRTDNTGNPTKSQYEESQ